MNPTEFWNLKPRVKLEEYLEGLDDLKARYRHFKILLDCSLDTFSLRALEYKHRLMDIYPSFVNDEVLFAKIDSPWGSKQLHILVVAESEEVLSTLKLMIET